MAGDGSGARRRRQCDGGPAPVAEQGGGDGIPDALSVAGSIGSTKRPRRLPIWLILRDGTSLTLPDGATHDMPVDDEFDDIDFCLSTGSLLFLVYCDRSCCLMNPSTGMTTRQKISLSSDEMDMRYPKYDRISKVVVSDQIVALLARDKVKIFTRGPPRRARSCSGKVWVPPGKKHVVDIAIFRGKLYVLAAKYGSGCLRPPELHVLDISENQTDVCIRATRRNGVEPTDHQLAIFFYLVPSDHWLLLVERQLMWSSPRIHLT